MNRLIRSGLRAASRLPATRVSRYSSVPNLDDHLSNSETPSDLLATRNGENHVSEELDLDPRVERHHPDTVKGRATQMFFFPENLDGVMAEELSSKTVPGTLKRDVAQYYSSSELRNKLDTQRSLPAKQALTIAASTFHQNYASAYAVLKEVRQKMPEGWKPNSVLDVGLGASAGMAAVNELFRDEEWSPDRKIAVILGATYNTLLTKQLFDTQKHESQETDTFTDKVRNSRINTSLPKNNNYKYDLIIASQKLDLLARQDESSLEMFSARLVSLLSPGGVLVLVDRGNPDGYERIARAREVLIRPMGDAGDAKKPVPWGRTRRLHTTSDEEIKKLKQEMGRDFEIEPEEMAEEDKVYLHVVGPCSHHGKCPFQQGHLRKNNSATGSWCSFTQKVTRPEYVMQLKRGKTLAASWDPKVTKFANKFSGGGRPGSGDVEAPSFSYIIIQRSTLPDAEIPVEQKWPRILKPPQKRHHHVVMNICGPEGGLHTWTVTKSQGKQEYLDARKALQRDQWALDAKVKHPVRKNYQMAVENEKISRIPQAQETLKKETLSSNQRRDLIKSNKRKEIKRDRKQSRMGGKEEDPLKKKKDEDEEETEN